MNSFGGLGNLLVVLKGLNRSSYAGICNRELKCDGK